MERALLEFSSETGGNFTRTEYTKTEKSMLLNYMKNAGELFEAGGYVDDVVTKKGTRIPGVGYRDNKYEWSTQDIYHIEKYDMAVKQDFIDHVKSKV